MNEELKPCPFCGSDKIIVEHIHRVRYGCRCDNCDTVQDPNARTESEAIAKWNTRQPDKELVEALEKSLAIHGIFM